MYLNKIICTLNKDSCFLFSFKNSSNQADSLKSSLNSVSVQTDDLTNSQSGGDQHEVSKQAERSDGVHSRTAELEAMVASLTTAISEGDRKCETLLEKNRVILLL